MPENQYIYSVQTLKNIVGSYIHIYQELQIYRKRIYHHSIVDPWLIAEFKADFDRALNSIGKGIWDGVIISNQMKSYRRFGRLQQIVIADIIGVDDLVLEGMGFYRVSQMRGYAYHLMADRLNGAPHHGTKTQFKANLLDGRVYN